MLEFAPHIQTAATPFQHLILINLSRTFKTDFITAVVQKAHPNTRIQTHTDAKATDTAPRLFVCDTLDAVTAFTQNHPEHPTGEVILTTELFAQTPKQTLLMQTDWYVIREMERKLFPEDHPFRVFRDGLRVGGEVEKEERPIQVDTTE